MSATRDHPGQALGVLGVVALDRDGDPLRHVPAPGQDAADQGVVDAELVAFFADALLGGAGDGVEEGALAGVQAHDHEPADVVEKRGDRELVAVGPADRAADRVGGVLGGEGVDPEALGPQVAAAVQLEEVEDAGGAGDRQHSGGLEHVDRLGDAGGAAGRAPPRLAARRTAIVRATSDSTASTSVADAGRLGGRRAHHPRLGLDQDREALDGLEGSGEARAGRGLARSLCRATACVLDLAVAVVSSSEAWADCSPNHRQREDVRFSRMLPKIEDESRTACSAE